MKGISREDFLDNCVGRLSNSSFWMRTNDYFGRLSNRFASEGNPTDSPRRVVQYIYQISVVSFQEQKDFVLKTMFCSHLA